MATPHLTAPVPSTTMPKGIPYIIINELAERFSFYGMRTILVVFMTKYLMDHTGAMDVMSDAEAKKWYHAFVAAVYLFPLAGALLSDWILGKYRTILLLSVVYCFGHFALAVDETRTGLMIGLFLIALGGGGIKPCVSAHVGDQFGPSNAHLLSQVFGWFYLSINLGAAVSSLATPLLLEAYGPGVAFGIPGLLMAIATVVFWMGRGVFVHVPPTGPTFLKDVLTDGSLKGIAKLVPVYLLVSMFWALFDQTGSAWVLQAKDMDRSFLGFTFLESQIQAINPVFILTFVPLFNFVIYPAVDKVFTLTPLRKMTIGMGLATLSFVPIAIAQAMIDAGQTPSIGWQVLGYVIITAAEVMVSITGLELSYTAAPNKVKSLVMSLWLLTVFFGNTIVSGLNAFLELPGMSDTLAGSAYYWFFVGLMGLTALVFGVVARFTHVETYIQEEAPAEAQLGGDE